MEQDLPKIWSSWARDRVTTVVCDRRLMSSAAAPATKPVMQQRPAVAGSEEVAGYCVTQNSGMKQSVQTTSKKSGGQMGRKNANITCTLRV